MASQSFLRVQSPARSLMRSSTKSILKRPAPLPLSPSAFTANFSVVVSASKGSAHVHFPKSPSMVAGMFTAHSANTYDRGPIITSPASADHSSWMGRMLSPTAHNAFKLCDPPRKTPGARKEQFTSLAPPPAAVTVSSRNLAPPSPFVDPRSPKPYVSRAGVSYDEITLYVPKPGDLGRALTTYPRSPYPSAPIEPEETDMVGEMTTRGRTADRSNGPSGFTRTRSVESRTMHRQAAQSMLSPTMESPRIVITSQPALESASPETRLNQEFWAAVTLEDAPAAGRSLKSPRLMFGNQDGTLWSPRPSKRESRSMVNNGFLSPAPRKQDYSKGMVASPSPNDPYASFPSFTLALNNMDGVIAYPPRARVE
jgi:hypothetical protein